MDDDVEIAHFTLADKSDQLIDGGFFKKWFQLIGIWKIFEISNVSFSFKVIACLKTTIKNETLYEKLLFA